MKKEKLIVIALMVLGTFLITRCSVERRRYTRGFNITSNIKARHPAGTEKRKQEPFVKTNARPATAETSMIGGDETISTVPVFASAKEHLQRPVKKRNLLFPADTCSDVITFMDGNELKIKIVEITPDYVAYRRCDYLDGPLMKTSSSEIFRVKYGNGLVRVFEHKQTAVYDQQQQYNNPPALKSNGWAITSFVTGIFSFLFIPAFVAIITGIVALVKFKNYPNTYKGKWMAVTGLIIGLFALALFLLLIFA